MLPPEPLERQGFTFTGWWTEPVNGGEVKASTKVKLAQPHTLYAHWRQNTYTIKFDLNGAVGELHSLEMKYGDTKALPLCKVPRLDYRFAGWSWTPEGSVDFVDGASVCNLTTEDADELTLYAVWEPHTWSIANYLNAESLSFTVTGDAEWMPDVITNHDGIASMRSGVIGINQQSTLKTSVKGKGTLSFWWKVICEPADSETGALYDYLELTIDGDRPETVQPIAGDVDWMQVTVRIDGEASEHEIEWTFVKDGFDGQELADVAWVDEVIWTPDSVTLSFSADDATEGDAPSPIISAFAETIVLPEVGSLARDGYAFVGWSDGSSTYGPGSTYEVGSDDVAFVAIWRELSISDILNARDFIFTTGGDARWAIDTTTTYDGVASLRSGAVAAYQESWVETSVSGAGTLSFWWKSDGLIYRNNPANYVQIAVDGTVVSNVAVTGWAYVSLNISEKGDHTVRWTYKQTRQQTSGENCAWLDEVSWKDLEPSVEGDTGAEITGDAEKGYVITPSEGAKEVKVSIPDGVDAAKVTVKVSPETKVSPNGAAVMVMRGENDITTYLKIPEAVDGVIDLSAATVKEEIVKETLSVEKGAEISLSPESPVLKTSETKPGLTYQFYEGTSLDALKPSGDPKIGDGNPWTPEIKVKGGTSAFYTIEVTK